MTVELEWSYTSDNASLAVLLVMNFKEVSELTDDDDIDVTKFC